ncbi:MAG TPA: hypothetical protein VIF09_27860 [Polyangiaceae bacterium]|jgi:hypothetical protein
MNVRRILLGGLAAGLAMNLLDFVTNAILFKKAWADAYAALHLAPSDAAVGGFWTAFDLLAGILIAFLYAAMRPRFGAGVRTAVIAGGVEWLLVHMTLGSHFVDGVFPAGALLGTGALELVSAVLGGVVAGKLYVEA